MFQAAICNLFLDPFAFRIKIPYPFQWGTPIFTAGHSFGMMGAVLVAAFEVKTKA
jgi:nucleobase transporter 1/2